MAVYTPENEARLLAKIERLEAENKGAYENGESGGYADWINVLEEEFNIDDLGGPKDFVAKFKPIFAKQAKVIETVKEFAETCCTPTICKAILSIINAEDK